MVLYAPTRFCKTIGKILRGNGMENEQRSIPLLNSYCTSWSCWTDGTILVIIANTLCPLSEKTALCSGENSLIQPLYTHVSCKIKAGQEQWWFAQEKTVSVTHHDITIPQYNPNHLPWLGYNNFCNIERFRSECNETWSYAFLFHSSRITDETVQKGKLMEELILQSKQY